MRASNLINLTWSRKSKNYIAILKDILPKNIKFKIYYLILIHFYGIQLLSIVSVKCQSFSVTFQKLLLFL